MKVRYTRTALQELEEILTYLASRNPPAAAAVAARIEQVIGWIAEFPRIGYSVDDGVRMLPLGRYPFLVFYSIDQDDVVIRNLRHHARSRRPKA